MNLLKEAGHVLATVAPTIATAVGGPFAGMAVTAIQKALGLSPSDTPAGNQAAIEQAMLTATPDQILALKQAEDAFTVQMEQLGITRQQLVYQDIASARAREIAVKDWTPRIIAYLVIVLVLVAEGSMFFAGQPKGVDGVVLGRILGTLDSALMLVLGYYFGSSAGSSNKDSTISSLAKGS